MHTRPPVPLNRSSIYNLPVIRFTLRHAASILLAAVFWFTSTAASAQTYIFDLLKSDPAILKAWTRVIPKDLRPQKWITRFEGPSTPLDTVRVAGKTFYLGWVCIPHNCGGNGTAFLIAVDGSEAHGAVSSTELGIRLRYLGAPDAEQRELLLSRLSG